jgi:protease-4
MDAHKILQSVFHVLAILVLLGFLALQGGSCMLLMSAMSDSGPAAGGPAERAGKDATLFGDAQPEARYLQIPVMGVISAEAQETPFGFAMEMSLLERVDRLLEHARTSDRIDGVLLDIDSPGGAVDPSDVIFQKLRRFREETGKPVVARLNGLAASGGFYVAVAADRIVAHPSCLTGSIGVIMQSFNFAGLFDRYGVELVTLTSGPNKDLLNPGRPMREEERAILMGIIGETYEQFVDAVAAGRGMDAAVVRAVADGRVWTARQALDLGFVDRVGYEEDLLAEMRDLAGVERVAVVRHRLPSKFWELLELSAANLAGRRQPASVLEALTRQRRAPGLYYLWDPQL